MKEKNELGIKNAEELLINIVDGNVNTIKNASEIAFKIMVTNEFDYALKYREKALYESLLNRCSFVSDNYSSRDFINKYWNKIDTIMNILKEKLEEIKEKGENDD